MGNIGTSLQPCPFTPESLSNSGTFQNAHGLKIYYRWWSVKEGVVPRGKVFICPGFGQHSGMYTWVAASLNEDGFEVFSMDHQGFGFSDGERAYVEVR